MMNLKLWEKTRNISIFRRFPKKTYKDLFSSNIHSDEQSALYCNENNHFQCVSVYEIKKKITKMTAFTMSLRYSTNPFALSVLVFQQVSNGIHISCSRSHEMICYKTVFYENTVALHIQNYFVYVVNFELSHTFYIDHLIFFFSYLLRTAFHIAFFFNRLVRLTQNLDRTYESISYDLYEVDHHLNRNKPNQHNNNK